LGMTQAIGLFSDYAFVRFSRGSARNHAELPVR
jgi:hypothetical protein